MVNAQNRIENPLIEHYLSVRAQTIKLIQPLSAEDMVVQPIVDVSPPKWHLAHTTWFFETFLLIPHEPRYKTFHPQYAYLFNSYYESVGQRVIRNQRGFLTRPSLDEILAYRQYVDEYMLELIFQYGDALQYWIELGLHHEQQHQELLMTDIKYILGTQPMKAAYSVATSQRMQIQPIEWISVPKGQYFIGFRGEGFCFDNETAHHKVYLDEFRIANRVISVQDYLEFIDDDGYHRPELWLSDGWDWLQQESINAPLYWEKHDQSWYCYRLSGYDTINVNEPVTHVSFYEADAYARWVGKRLATEFEWEVACQTLAADEQNTAQFLENGIFHPAYPDNASGICGSSWEWTNSAYLPYPGYQQSKGALGEYNGKFMINQMVLRGGSCTTPTSHFRPTYRNFFQPDKRWQFTGIRLVQDQFSND